MSQSHLGGIRELTEESGINKQIFPVVSFELSFQEHLRYGVKDDEGNKRAK